MKITVKIRDLEVGTWKQFADTHMYAGDRYQIADDLGLFMEIKLEHGNPLELLLSMVYYQVIRRVQRWLTCLLKF